MIWSENSPTIPADSSAPPRPPRALATTVVRTRTRVTSTPRAAAASGASPAARNSNPARVWFSTQAITTSDSGNSHTITGCRNSTGPSSGIRPNPGTGHTPNGWIDGGLS